MKRLRLILFVGLALRWTDPAEAQTRVKLSTIIPGTESVQLISNGDFQSQGTVTTTNTHPYPTGWTRQADMFADAGTNMVPANNGVVARAQVNSGSSVCQYKRNLTLQPATDYVFSAYLWNMGDSANHVTTVVDLNDATNEPQITLSSSDANADQGYFVYKSFNTTSTGTNVTVRLFYDSPVGAFTASKYYPVAAQWDNLAITLASEFIGPQANSGTNLHPAVSIYSPTDGTNIVFRNALPTLPICASASDLDGTIAKVEFYAGATRLGEIDASPYTFLWSGFASGSYVLTAVATDNLGATTTSAPVSLSVTSPPTPVLPALKIVQSGTNLLLSWTTNCTTLSLECATNLLSPDWQTVATPCVLSSNQYYMTLPNAAQPRFFQLGTTVDPSTLDRKMLMGYQGWFACAGDGSPMNKWVHWFDTGKAPVATNLTVDFWPDTSELDADELYPTSLTMPDGSAAKVYSPWNQKTVLRHFKWMKDYGVDGVFLQRFSSELSSTSNFKWRNGVATNIQVGAEMYGRVFAIMYDVSGQNESTLVSTLTNDWAYLVNTMHITDSPRYIRHHGKPVVTIWGFGFNTRSNTVADAQTVISWFKSAGCTVMGGVPTYWRTLGNDSQTNAAWADVYRSFDVLSPWLVTRFSTTNAADSFKTGTLIPDLNECRLHSIDYMPVVWPGFSWTNVNGGPYNQIPRYGGAFYWRQVYNSISAGCTMLYGAMFDEMNEGTSMFKMAPTLAELPTRAALVPLNVDGVNLPSDWYLRLAGQATKMLRGQIPVVPQMPISP
jgi:hypothetical protein